MEKSPADESRGAGRASNGQDTAGGLVRSEETLDVRVERRAAARVRLRKEIVVENVTVTLQLRREQVVVDRLPADHDEAAAETASTGTGDGADGGALTLWAEEPVITTRLVPRERVWLSKEETVAREPVTEELRREEVVLEGDRSPTQIDKEAMDGTSN